MNTPEREHAAVGEARFMAVVLQVPPEEDYTPDRPRQMDILSRLPHDLLYELAGHQRTSFLEQQKFAKLRGVSFDTEDFDDETVLREFRDGP